ncbi:MAG: hypothetical protein CVU86_00905 [Firmicutes bacterium HGW-Firmicutes-11]|nr:MAG: hypothetical protein CVU86_00905 [Firmicutes bacterium HGW-Firmicutes-11]
MKRIKNAITIALVVIVVFTAVLFATGVVDITGPFSSSHDKDTRSMLLTERIEAVSNLATVQFHYQEILEHTDSLNLGDWKLPFGWGDKKILISYRAYLNGGCKLLGVEETGENGVTVTLGKGEIFDNVLDLDSLRIYDVQNGIFNRFDIADDTSLIKEDMKRYEEEVRVEVAATAETNAKAIMDNFLSSLGYEDITVRFQ